MRSGTRRASSCTMPRIPKLISEAQAARKLINAIIDDTSTPSDNAALARIDSRIDSLMSDPAVI